MVSKGRSIVAFQERGGHHMVSKGKSIMVRDYLHQCQMSTADSMLPTNKASKNIMW